ncbi:MAG: hypothetical protein RIM84_14915 [Alphaproteobacteria bacterium]
MIAFARRLVQGLRALPAALALLMLAPAVADAQENLTVAEVQTVIAQAAAEATARGMPATIAVTDRVGNVLGVFRMTGAPDAMRVVSGRTVGLGFDFARFGLDNLIVPLGGIPAIPTLRLVPTELGAIAKAVTGAYLSSGGNAFTTRTANQIVQENFNVGELGQPSGPLFGVQFSQLPCSDLSSRFIGGNVNDFIGPKRSPLGLAADPGGLPLYKNGVPVGGIGVLADGEYGIDPVITDVDESDDEMIALAGTRGFEPPVDIMANRITVEGKTLRFTDKGMSALRTDPGNAPAFAAINGTVGNLIMVRGYNAAAAIVRGRAFGTPESGVRPETTGIYAPTQPFVLVDGNNNNRYPPRAGTDGILTAAEATEFVRQALKIAFAGRAQIRRPLNSFIQVTVSLVDTNGAILALARTPDGPMFGTDVSLQKARTAAFFSNPVAAAALRAADANITDLGAPFPNYARIGPYVDAVQAFVGPTALSDGIAFADRSGGNLSRPFYPDGSQDNQPGPFSKPIGIWSPFNVGLQLDLVLPQVVTHILFTLGISPTDTPVGCTPLNPTLATGLSQIPNGIQIFPGSVPVYKNGVLAGGLGVSGDGIDQDDMISFLGAHKGGLAANTGIGNAPANIRADTLTPQGTRLRYVNCPFKPFVDSDEQSPCKGK